MDQQIRFCTSFDGAQIAYAVSGDGPPVLLLPNWLTHLHYQWRSVAWRPWLEALSTRYRLIRFDLRGCGLSDRDVSDLSFDTWVRDTEALADALDLDQFSVVGVCQGGPIAVEFAARHPGRLRNLVLHGTYARGKARRTVPFEPEKAKLMLEMMEIGWANEDHAFLGVFASQFQPEGSLEHLRSWCELQRLATSPSNAVALTRAMFELDVQSSARRLACPALVTHCARDAAVPLEEGRLLARLIPNARFVQLDSANHFLLASEPAWAAMVGLLHEFLPPPAARAGLFAELTERERDVLDFLARGLDNHQIAAHLGVSEKTVRNQVSSIFAKLCVDSRARAVVVAREAGYGGQSSAR